MDVNEHDFKHCVGSFATGVTIITTRDTHKKPVGVTINSFASVSLHPPLILFCLDKTSASFPCFTQAKHFIVNILSEKQEHLSRQFSAPGHKWEGVDSYDGQTHCPILPDILAYIECETFVTHEGGDHVIFIGKAINLKRLSEHGKPLLYHRGNYINRENQL